MRIVAGTWGGRRLRTPPSDGTRPTTDRVRESVFASLGSLLGGFEGVRVLDLFAGSGALGLEALSRGAAEADLVDSGRDAAAVLRANVDELAAAGARIHRRAAEVFAAETDGGPYDLVLLDPPYALATPAIGGMLGVLRERGRLTDHVVVVVERSSREPFVWPEGFAGLRERRYGETTVWFGELVASPA